MRPDLANVRLQVAIVHVVGPIGAGKSTMIKRANANPAQFMSLLHESDKFEWIREWSVDDTMLVTAVEDPERWKTETGESYLDLVYANPKAHAAQFQSVVMIERVRAARDALISGIKQVQRKENIKHLLVVTDGCVNTDCQIFAQKCHDDGSIGDEHWKTYFALFEKIEATWVSEFEDTARRLGMSIRVDLRGTLYLSTPFDETVRRIEERGRDCEKTLPNEYKLDVFERHEYLMSSSDYRAGPVQRVCDTDLTNDCQFVLIKDEE